jgi:hypothetical protein
VTVRAQLAEPAVPGTAPRFTPARGVQRRGSRGCGDRSPPDGVSPLVRRALDAPGRPLDGGTRALMEGRLGHDFGDVRVHADAAADAAAGSLGAAAFTLGSRVVFAAGRYEPGAERGRRLLAHELAHVVQQRAAGGGAAGALHEAEADRAAQEVTRRVGGGRLPALTPATGLQRQHTASCPSRIDFSSSQPVHVPPCGTFRATANVRGVTWSLGPDPTPVDPSTTISAAGAIAIGASQRAGRIKVTATSADGSCFYERPLTVRSHPTRIASTRVVSRSSAAYGGVFDHVFTSADGNTGSLQSVAVGERFIGVPTPAAATHAVGPPTHPFGGTFTLTSSTLTPDARDNWFLTAGGELGGRHDEVVIGHGGIDVGRFVASASNPRPPQALPAVMALRQGLHWYCPQAPASSRWRMPGFVTVPHDRTLRARRGVVEFVTSVNGVEIVQPYVGPVAVFNAAASPATTPPSPARPAARARVRISADTLPSALPARSRLVFSFVGASLGCTLARDRSNPHAAVLAVGRARGSVTVQVADVTGRNADRVTVTIA